MTTNENETTTQCVKVGYVTRADAEEVMKRVVYRNHLSGLDHRSKGLNVYECDDCGQFHYGHRLSAPLLYHYTVGSYAVRILEAGFLRPDRPRYYTTSGDRSERRVGRGTVLDEPHPLLWFSRDAYWDYSVTKGHCYLSYEVPSHGTVLRWVDHYGLAAHDNATPQGVYRFAVRPSVAPLRWHDYLAMNPTPHDLRDGIATMGDPTDWCATDCRVSLDDVVSVECFVAGRWSDLYELLDADFDFDDYLPSRMTAYRDVYPNYPALPDVSWFSTVSEKQHTIEYSTLRRDAFNATRSREQRDALRGRRSARLAS